MESSQWITPPTPGAMASWEAGCAELAMAPPTKEEIKADNEAIKVLEKAMQTYAKRVDGLREPFKASYMGSGRPFLVVTEEAAPTSAEVQAFTKAIVSETGVVTPSNPP